MQLPWIRNQSADLGARARSAFGFNRSAKLLLGVRGIARPDLIRIRCFVPVPEGVPATATTVVTVTAGATPGAVVPAGACLRIPPAVRPPLGSAQTGAPGGTVETLSLSPTHPHSAEQHDHRPPNQLHLSPPT